MSVSQVLLRIKESEIQYLKQEIHSLKDELQSALRVRWRGNPIHSLRKQITQCSVTGFLCHFVQDKKYATDKYKDIYTELSIVKAKADCDISKLKEKLLMATEALGEQNVDGSVTSGYGAVNILIKYTLSLSTQISNYFFLILL